MKRMKAFLSLWFGAALFAAMTAPVFAAENLLSKMKDADWRALNIFFSNFCETRLADFNGTKYDDAALINFAVQHNVINNAKLFKPDKAGGPSGTSYIERKNVDATIEKYFGIKGVKPQSVEDSPIIYKNNRYYWDEIFEGAPWFAGGQAVELYDAGNRTMTAVVEFYEDDGEFANNPDKATKEFYAPKKTWKGETASCFKLTGLYQAKIMPYTYGGKKTWKLLEWRRVKPEDIFTFKDGAWYVRSGDRRIAFEGVSGTGERGKSDPVQWCVVNPDETEEAKGLKAGVLLYIKDMEESGSPYVYLLLDEEAIRVDGLSFDDSENVVVISRGGRFTELLSVYNLGAVYMEWDGSPLESYQSFLARNDSVFWVVEHKEGYDITGFAFTLADEEVTRPEEAGLFAATAAIFCPPQSVQRVNDGLAILKKATKTENYEISDVNGDGTELTLTVTSVKTEKDWEDVDKWQESEMTIEVPPMPEEEIPGEVKEE